MYRLLCRKTRRSSCLWQKCSFSKTHPGIEQIFWTDVFLISTRCNDGFLRVPIMSANHLISSRQGQRSGHVKDSQRPHFRTSMGWCRSPPPHQFLQKKYVVIGFSVFSWSESNETILTNLMDCHSNFIVRF